VKALYATGFFRDVRLERQGDVLIVAVQERPTISSITFVGNKEFDTDTVKKGVKNIGLTRRGSSTAPRSNVPSRS